MAEKHYNEQVKYTNEYLIPYFKRHIPNWQKLKVLEIGCAEGGLINVFHNLEIDATGVEISEKRVQLAISKNPNLKIVVGDIMDENLPNKLGKFDFIIMRDVIEHIPNKEITFTNIEKLANPNAYLFFSFPPKFSPFAGHQQIGKTILKAVPYLHLLPTSILKRLAKTMGERDYYVGEIKLNYSTGMQIQKFENLCKSKKFIPIKKDVFLFRPIYAYRFGLPTIKLPNIPLIREVLTFGYETLLQKI